MANNPSTLALDGVYNTGDGSQRIMASSGLGTVASPIIPMVQISGGGGGGGGAVTVADGADVAQGSKADAAYAGSGAATLVSILKGIYAAIISTASSTGPGSAATATRTQSALATVATVTTPAVTTVTGTVLNANASRLGYSIKNDGTNTGYYLKGTGSASITNYSFSLVAGAYYENNDYSGAIQGIWPSGTTGNSRVTELT